MRNPRSDKLIGAVWRLGVFSAVCLLGTFALVAVFGQLRFDSTVAYTAEFANVSGLEEGNFVRIAGVEVGKIKHLAIRPDNTVAVQFSADSDVTLTEGTKAVIRYDNLIGGRYLELQEGAGGTRRLQPGQTIALTNTEPALDLDALIGGFRPLFRALDPDQVNVLASQLVAAFQGQGPTISSFLNQASVLTNRLADRDELFSEVIGNLNKVLEALGGQAKQFDKAVDSLAQLIAGLSERKTDIATGLAYSNAAAAGIADLLAKARAPANVVVSQADRVATLVQADRDYFDDLLNTLPDAYRTLARQGLYGDFFSFYVCDLLFKVNGKGGQPVYVKVASQSTGRCTPK